MEGAETGCRTALLWAVLHDWKDEGQVFGCCGLSAQRGIRLVHSPSITCDARASPAPPPLVQILPYLLKRGKLPPHQEDAS